MTRDALEAWTVYDSPADYPGRFVARCWRVSGATPEPEPTDRVLVRDSLAALREALPMGLCMIPRSPGDDMRIVETWL